MPTMRAVQVPQAGGEFELVEREMLPLEQAADAYERMMSGDARFRMVLTTGACAPARKFFLLPEVPPCSRCPVLELARDPWLIEGASSDGIQPLTRRTVAKRDLDWRSPMSRA